MPDAIWPVILWRASELTRFFLEELNYSEADTMMVVGAFAAIGPLFAIAGGSSLTNYLGLSRSYHQLFCFYLGLHTASAWRYLITRTTAMAGIALASYGRGLMSPSYPSLYKRTFATHKDFENGFPINYSVNNIGAFLGQYLFPILTVYIGFSGGFTLSAIMACLGLLTLIMLKKPFSPLGKPIDTQPISAKTWGIFIAVSVVMIALVFFMFSNMDVGQNIVYAIGWSPSDISSL